MQLPYIFYLFDVCFQAIPIFYFFASAVLTGKFAGSEPSKGRCSYIFISLWVTVATVLLQLSIGTATWSYPNVIPEAMNESYQAILDPPDLGVEEEEAELLMQYFRDAQPLPMQKKRTLIEGPYILYFLVEKHG